MAQPLSSFNAAEIQSVGGALNMSPEELGNRPEIEYQWAVQTFHHAETYFNLITSVDPSRLKLTKIDDYIYERFCEDFSDLKVDMITENSLKSDEAKEKWRPYCNEFKDKVEDFNFGTLLRLDCQKDYSEENSLLVTRIQFLAIEIARNRKGFNSNIKSQSDQKSS